MAVSAARGEAVRVGLEPGTGGSGVHLASLRGCGRSPGKELEVCSAPSTENSQAARQPSRLVGVPGQNSAALHSPAAAAFSAPPLIVELG